MKLKHIIAGIALAATASLGFAQSQKLVIINAGSKGGGFFMETSAFSKDLAKDFDIEYINPGNYCVAQGILNKLPKNQPAVVIWDSSYEAAGRENKTCPMQFETRELLRTHYDSFQICSKRETRTGYAFTRRDAEYKVGYVNPANIFTNNLKAVNQSFGTKHKAVQYASGTPAVIAALNNGEIDYGYVESKSARPFVKAGGTCSFNLDTVSSGAGLEPLAAKDTKNTKLKLGYYVLLVAKNADDATISKIKTGMQRAHQDPNSATFKIWDGSGMKFTWENGASFTPSWEQSVTQYLDK